MKTVVYICVLRILDMLNLYHHNHDFLKVSLAKVAIRGTVFERYICSECQTSLTTKEPLSAYYVTIVKP